MKSEPIPGLWYALKGAEEKPYRYVGLGVDHHIFVAVDYDEQEKEYFDATELNELFGRSWEVPLKRIYCRWNDWPEFKAKLDKRKEAGTKAAETRKQRANEAFEADMQRRNQEFQDSRPAIEKRLEQKPGVASASFKRTESRGKEVVYVTVSVHGAEHVEKLLAYFDETMPDA